MSNPEAEENEIARERIFGDDAAVVIEKPPFDVDKELNQE